MTVNFSPSFSGFISVEDREGKELFKQDVHSVEEIKEFINANGKSVPCIIPLRTYDWHVFAKDVVLFTFPNLNKVLKVNNIALRIIGSCCAIYWDVITLLPRAIIVPFKIWYNRQYQEHPLITLVKANCISLEIKKLNLLQIKTNFNRIQIHDPNFAANDIGEGHCYVSTDCFTEASKSSFDIYTSTYQKEDDQWKYKRQTHYRDYTIDGFIYLGTNEALK